jgi:hypothetical protein
MMRYRRKPDIVKHEATRVYETLDSTTQEARHQIFAALVHIDPTKGTVTRKRATLETLKIQPGSEAFLHAFLGAHLLITDDDTLTKQPVVTLAHEALITHWDELALWIKEHRSDILARQRLAEQTGLWIANDRKKSYLLAEGRLGEAGRVAASHLFTLNPDEIRFISHSKRRAKIRFRILQASLLVFIGLTLATGLAVVWARKSERLAVHQSEVAESRLKASARTHWNLGKDHLQNGDIGTAFAFLSRASEQDSNFRELAETVVLNLQNWNRSLPPILTVPLSNSWESEIGFSPNGNLFFTSDERLRLWSITTGSETHLSVVGKFKFAAFSGDSRYISGIMTDNRVIVFDTKSGQIVSQLSGPTDLRSLSFSPNNLQIILDSVGSLALWSFTTASPPSEIEDFVGPFAFTPGGSLIANKRGDGLYVVTGSDHTLVTKQINGSDRLLLDAQGRRLISYNTSGDEIFIWGMESHSLVKYIKYGGRIMDVVFSSSGTHVLVATYSGTIHLIDAASGSELWVHHCDDGPPFEAAFSTDDSQIIAAIHVDDVQSACIRLRTSDGELFNSTYFTGRLKSAAIPASGAWCATRTHDANVQIWETLPDISNPFLVIDEKITEFKLSPNDKFMYLTTDKSEVKIFDTATRKEIFNVSHVDTGTSLSFSIDSSKFLGHNSKNNKFIIADIIKRNEVAIDLESQGSRLCAMHPNGSVIISIDDSGILSRHLTTDGNAMVTGIQPSNHRNIRSLKFSPDGRRIAAFSETGFVIFDSDTLSVVSQADIGKDFYMTSFSPNGNLLALTSYDGYAIGFWNTNTGFITSGILEEIDPLQLILGSNSNSAITITKFDEQFTAQIWDWENGSALAKLDSEYLLDRAALNKDDDILGLYGGASLKLWGISSRTNPYVIYTNDGIDDITSASFANTTNMLYVSSANKIDRFTVPVAEASLPSWLPELLIWLGGAKIDSSGEVVKLNAEERNILRSKLLGMIQRDQSEISEIAQKFFIELR